MVRNYKKKSGSRSFQNYRSEEVEGAPKEMAKNVSSRVAGEKYGIPYRTLQNKKNGKSVRKPGGQCVLSPEEESQLVSLILTASTWGYPLTAMDLRCIVKRYLDDNGKKYEKFKDNLPGYDWAAGFLKRHTQVLTVRKCQNVKRARASVSSQDINIYFDNLEQTAKDVLPEDKVNYDETNVTDDPGEVKVVVRRSVKHADRVLDATKSNTSIMFAGTAKGEILPPYIVYKAMNLYDTWMERGPQGAVYNRSKSGWFDMLLFEDWFFKIPLRYFQTRPPNNPKLLIGDNCASHLSPKVIRSCMDNNIKFVFLPKKTLHILANHLILAGSSHSRPSGNDCFQSGNRKTRESSQKVFYPVF